jgi:hypothetical protein
MWRAVEAACACDQVTGMQLVRVVVSHVVAIPACIAKQAEHWQPEVPAAFDI